MGWAFWNTTGNQFFRTKKVNPQWIRAGLYIPQGGKGGYPSSLLFWIAFPAVGTQE